MGNHNKWKFHVLSALTAALVVFISFAFCIPSIALAKSLYVNRDINANSPIRAYDIQPAPNYLVFQKDSVPTRYGGVGLAIDTDSEILFVTFETSGTLDIVDAKTLKKLGQVTAPNAYNLAGIVVDQDKQKVYTVNRGTKTLYVYLWNAATKTLTLETTKTLNELVTSGTGLGAHGIALDETHDKLYVCDVSLKVHIYNTGDWSYAGYISASQKAMGIAVDVKKGFVYTGNAYEPYGSVHKLLKYDLNTGIETSVDIRYLSGGISTDNVVGLAVDRDTSLLYITTGNQGTGGSDRIIVFDSNLNMLYATGDIGNPTGIVVPGKEISYNPLNLSKTDGLAVDECVVPGTIITYNICFDNMSNAYPVNNTVLTDQLPSEETFISATGSGVYNAVTHTVTWNFGTLPAEMPQTCVQLIAQIDPSTPWGSSVINSSMIDSDETPPTTQNRITDICSNQPPVANPDGPYSAKEGLPVIFDGSGSYDPDGSIVSYKWELNSGGSWVIIGASQSISYTFTSSGTFDLRLTVTDNLGSTGEGTTTVTVIPNNPPIADAGPDQTVEQTSPSGAQVTLNGLGSSDPDGDSLSYLWTGPFGTMTGAVVVVDMPHGISTVTLTVNDGRGGSSSDTATITVQDTTPPVVTPPADVVAEATGIQTPVTIGMATATDAVGVVSITNDAPATFPIGTTIVTWTANDAAGNIGTATQRITVQDTTPPVTINVMANPIPVAVTIPVTLTATVIDTASPIEGAEYRIDSGAYVPMNATDGVFDSLSEDVVATIPSFTLAGVYTICVHGTDASLNTSSEECIFLPVYDPTGSFVTGGGWITSPEGAYIANPSLTGRANFGFVSKYLRGAAVPTGNTEFQFKIANLNFHSTSYDWLVVAGAKAQYKGTGTINGVGEYKFMLTAIDSEISGGGGQDRFRIKIWTEVNGVEEVVYDNGLGADDLNDNATTEISGGAIVIHK